VPECVPRTGRLDVLGVLRAICTVVGAFVLYCAVIAALWHGLIHAGRRRAHRRAGHRAAARGIPVVEPDRREWLSRPWDELPSWLWPDQSWAVAVVLLAAPAVRDSTAPFVDFGNHVIDWTALLEASRAWPPDQRRLVQDAYQAARQVGRARLEPEDGITTLS
jgi:hypothetical protein